MKQKSVLIFGATGLVGDLLLHQCLADDRVSVVKIFVRKRISLSHPKLVQVETTADSLHLVAGEIAGDVVFNCLGTTLRQAGSQEAQYAIDCAYPVRVAQLAAQNGISCMVNVSSVGASATGNFYLKTKADMEKGVGEAIGEKAYFMRPSFITGNRKVFRLGERIGIYLMILLNPLFIGGFRKFRSIAAQKIAAAMLHIGLEQPTAPKILHFDEIVQWAKYNG
jgi:uncharacterized protein YbjT (DUF2867 family)